MRTTPELNRKERWVAPLVVDGRALACFFDPADLDHALCSNVVLGHRGHVVVPALCTPQADDDLVRRGRPGIEGPLADAVELGLPRPLAIVHFEPEEDLHRSQELRPEHGLDYVDAFVIAVAERVDATAVMTGGRNLARAAEAEGFRVVRLPRR